MMLLYLALGSLLLPSMAPKNREEALPPDSTSVVQHLPVCHFDKQSHDFGTFKKDKVKQHTFTVTNTGQAPLVIHHVATSCGCTTTNYTKEAILPGKKGTVTVQFNGASLRTGPFRKSITVYVNTVHAYTRLFVKGTTQ